MTVVVAGACLITGIIGAAVIGRLAGRRQAPLRAKLITFFVGLVIAETMSLPALVLALAAPDIKGLGSSGLEQWLIATLYVLLTVYAIARLFPWREVDALVSAPDATLRGIMAKLKKGNDGSADAR